MDEATLHQEGLVISQHISEIFAYGNDTQCVKISDSVETLHSCGIPSAARRSSARSAEPTCRIFGTGLLLVHQPRNIISP